MVKNLVHNILHVIHKHKKPYNKAVIKHYEYIEPERVTTDIGVRTDVMKRRDTRQAHYMVKREALNAPSPKIIGRPKGSKTKEKGNPSQSKNKRGRRACLRYLTMARNSF
jgi:hypothetical protein